MADYARGLRDTGSYYVGKTEIWNALTLHATRLQKRNQDVDGQLALVPLVDRYANGRNMLARTLRLFDEWSSAFVPWTKADRFTWEAMRDTMRTASEEQPSSVLRLMTYRAYVMGGILAARASNFQPRDADDPETVPSGVAGNMEFLFPTLFCCALYAFFFHSENASHTFEMLMEALVGHRHAYCDLGATPVVLPGAKPVDKVGRSQFSYYEGFLIGKRALRDWLSFFMDFPYCLDAQGQLHERPCTRGFRPHPFAITSGRQLEEGLMMLPHALRMWRATPRGSQLLVGRYNEAVPRAAKVLHSNPGLLWVDLIGDEMQERPGLALHYTYRGPPTFIMLEWDGKTFRRGRGLTLHTEEGSSNYAPLRIAYATGRPAAAEPPAQPVLRGG